MPYIKNENKFHAMSSPSTSGELNYKITETIIDYLEERGGLVYSNLNEVVGALECAKLELYRRVILPYEDTKIKENGDVYPKGLLT